MVINKLISNYNFNKSTENRVKYIVVHYVGALGDAKANASYYASGNKDASAHYFVGHNGDIWQSVEDKNVAWHCGSKAGYRHFECRNANSIGVEMCVKKRNTSTLNASDKDWYFEKATIDSTVELIKKLMVKYNIDIDHIVRHYDVTGKTCPAPYVHDENAWKDFKNLLLKGPEEPIAPISGEYYRVRISWDDSKSQIGAFTILENAKRACKEGYSVFDNNGKIVYKKESTSYNVKVTAKKGVNIRKGAGTNYAKAGSAIPYNKTLTITRKNNGWGYTTYNKVSGWISLKYTKKS